MPADSARATTSTGRTTACDKALDHKLIEKAKAAIEKGEHVSFIQPVRNVNRTVGAMLSGMMAKKYGHDGLPDDTIHIQLQGTAGQSFGAFLAHGITLDLVGDGNDYVGKGLSGGRIIVRPTNEFRGKSEREHHLRQHGAVRRDRRRSVLQRRRRRALRVRNSGATAVVEGTGDHGCEYMTGGTVVVLGETGRNFAAGMSGGVAYVYDPDGTFASKCNKSMVALDPVLQHGRTGTHGRQGALWHTGDDRRSAAQGPDRASLPVHRFAARQGAARELGRVAPQFVKVFPTEYKRALGEMAREEGEARKRSPPDPQRWHQQDVTFSTDAPRATVQRCDTARSRSPLDTDREENHMGKATGFLEFERHNEAYEARSTRVKHYKEFVAALTDDEAKIQGARCMDCGIPFCNNGCPVNNIIPDFNDLVFHQDWKNAIEVLHSTNNFPEFTGRICPAPCEAACTLGINDDPVGIKSIEHAIIDKAWDEGWVAPQPPKHKTGKKVAVVGSGPAGMAAAQQLARAGHDVTVFEKNDRIGGLLRYGIPDFKLEKWLIDRRMRRWKPKA